MSSAVMTESIAEASPRTPALTNRLEPAQRTAARVAGFAYLFNYITSVAGVLTLSRIRGSGDFGEKAQRVFASEHLYRTALMSIEVGWVTIVILAFALYVTLEPVNKRLAQIALLFELGQACVGAVTVVVSFAALRLYTLPQASGHFQNEQLQALVSVAREAENSGFNVSMVFLGLGSLVFFYLFYKSRYIPRALAGFAVVASAVMVIVSLISLVFPEYAVNLQYGWAPMGLAEIATAFWLMIAGIRPAAEA